MTDESKRELFDACALLLSLVILFGVGECHRREGERWLNEFNRIMNR